MNGLVLFRSYYGNTKQVADAIAQQIQEMGHQAMVRDLRQKLPELDSIDFVFIGSPTRMARVNRKALRTLKELHRKDYSRRSIAIFDVYGPLPTDSAELKKTEKWIQPGAAGIMQKTARDLGLRVFPNLLRCEIKGLKGPLADKELQRARTFAREFVSSL